MITKIAEAVSGGLTKQAFSPREWMAAKKFSGGYTGTSVKHGLIGAGIGAAAGALKPKNDDESTVGNMTRGAIGGGLVGGIGSHIARKPGVQNWLKDQSGKVSATGNSRRPRGQGVVPPPQAF